MAVTVSRTYNFVHTHLAQHSLLIPFLFVFPVDFQTTEEFFAPGRRDQLKSRSVSLNGRGLMALASSHGVRETTYYAESRADGLIRRIYFGNQVSTTRRGLYCADLVASRNALSL